MYDITDFDELKRGITRTIFVRRITLGVFSLVALFVLLASRISYLNPLFYSPLVWFLLTFPFKYLVDRQRTLRALHWVHTGFFVVEVLLITFLVHFMGGSEWIGVTFYMFTVIYANIFLTRFQGSLVTLLVVLSYSGLVLLEYGGLIPHRSLFSAVEVPHRNLAYSLTTILAGAVGLYAVVALTVRSFADVFAHKNRMLARRERELSRLSRRLLTAQDEERRRIARTLHDDLIQTLAAIKLRLTPQKDRLGREAYAEVCDIVDRSIEQTRSLAYSVRPPLLDDLGLVPSLERLAEAVAAESGLTVDIEAHLPERPHVGVEGLLFFVAQEAMQNVVRHANADRVCLDLHAEGDTLRLTVRDDGVGRHPNDPQGLGLRGIRERVELSGGSVSIRPAPAGGTIVAVEVPSDADSSRDRR
jgi:signal transduction histidine kinase